MKTTIRMLSAAAAVGGLAACTTATPYTQASGPGDDGYRTERVEEDVYRVVFEGNENTPRQTVETYLLYRAAQVAQNTGHDYFAVVARDTNENVDLEAYGGYTPYTSAPGYYGYGLSATGPYPYYTAYPYGAGYTGFDTVGPPVVDVDDSYTAVAFIELYENEPAGPDSVYDASEVIARLGDEIRRPGEDPGI